MREKVFIVIALFSFLFCSCISITKSSPETLLDSNHPGSLSGFVKVNKKFSESGKICFELYGKYPTELIAAKYIPVEPDKSYRVSVRLRSLSSSLPASAYLGLRMYDKKHREMRMVHVKTFPNTDTYLTVAAKAGSKELFVAKKSIWPKIKACVVTFNIKNDYSDLPNFDFSPRIAQVIDHGRDYRVTLTAPLGRSYPRGTKVRLQSPWGAPLYDLAEGWIPAQWKEFSAKLSGIVKHGAPKTKFWSGTKYVKPFIWFGNWNRKPKKGAKLLVEDFKFTVEVIAKVQREHDF